jgi:hypothetical protein
MVGAIRALFDPKTLSLGLDQLCGIPGLRLVMATKIYRFCCPEIGAAVDRHASYFFNSLKATSFQREWSTGKRSTSRLAIYGAGNSKRNRNEYLDVYLPLLKQIADYLNRLGFTYKCATTEKSKVWRPADVEMAAYYWWACNGPR